MLRYGIPEFKMEKRVLDRRIQQMVAEGTAIPDRGGRRRRPRPPSNCGPSYDAVVLAGGATAWRDLPIPGRELTGIHQAMEYLPPANRVQQGDLAGSALSAQGKRVVIIGGGDTGADCLGTAHRQGAVSVHQFEILAQPPALRPEANPWPTWPLILRTSLGPRGGRRASFRREYRAIRGQ